jgi:phospholipid transport system substrate-binding protein
MRIRNPIRGAAVAALVAVAVAAPLAAAPLIASPASAQQAQGQAAAEAVIRDYQAALLDTMKKGKALGFEGRYKALEAPVRKAFDLPFLARYAVGPAWNNFSEAERTKVAEVFARYSISQHAARFKAWDKEKFESLGTEDTGRGYLLVKTQIVTGDGEKIALDYLMGNRGGQWKIVDVFAKGTISEVATRRADFAATVKEKGAAGLIKDLEEKIALARKE